MRGEKNIRGFLVIILATFVILSGYSYFEPIAVSAVSDSVNVTQTVTSEITITSPTDVVMSGSIAGMSGGSATGSATWTVSTDDSSGFNMQINSDAVNCLRNGPDHFNDYAEAVAGTPDFGWMNPAVSAFGYTVETATADDTAQPFKDDGSACGGTGTLNTADVCWKGFSTTPFMIVNRTGLTGSSGEAETVKFKSQLASGQFLPEGNYVANITVTAVTNP